MSKPIDLSQVAYKMVLTSAEAGALTGRDPKTIAALCDLGVIVAKRDSAGGPWRIPRRELDAWVAAGQPFEQVTA